MKFVSDDGIIWNRNEKGEWVKHPYWEKKDGEKRNKQTVAEATATNGAKVNITIESLHHSIFRLDGTGFHPHEVVNLISNSSREVLHFPITADENGNLQPIELSPAVIGKSGGVCNIDLLRKEDSLHLKFSWGTERPKKTVQFSD